MISDHKSLFDPVVSTPISGIVQWWILFLDIVMRIDLAEYNIVTWKSTRDYLACSEYAGFTIGLGPNESVNKEKIPFLS